MPLRPQAVFVPCATALLALSASALPETPYTQVDNVVTLPPLTETITRTCGGDVDGDASPDVALLAGGQVFVAFGIATHGNLIVVPEAGSAIDLALTPRLSPQSRSQIAVTRDEGVFLISRQSDPEHPDPWVSEQVLESDATLLGATLVRSADLDGNGRSDLIVVLSDERTVRVLLRQIDGNWSGSLSPFTLQTKVKDLAALEYDSGPCLELAIQTAGSARVHRLGGEFVAMARNVVGGAPAGMAVMPIPESQYSRVAYLATATGGGYDLHLLESGVLDTLFVGNLVPRSLHAADHDDDGDFDLLVDKGESGIVVLLENGEVGTTECSGGQLHPFDCCLEEQLELEVGPQEGTMRNPAWGDFDNDDQPDLIVPGSPSLGTWRIEFRPRLPLTSEPPGPPQSPSEPGDDGTHPVFGGTKWANPGTESGVPPQLEMRIADVWDDERNSIQVTAWRKQNDLAAPAPEGTEVAGRFNGFYSKVDVQDESSDYFVLPLPFTPALGSGTPPTPFQVPGGAFAAGGTNGTVFFVEVRSVQLTSNEVVSAGRKYTAGLALNFDSDNGDSDSAFTYITGLPGNWGASVPTTVFNSGFQTSPSPPYKIGGLVPMPAMPAFAPGFLVYATAEQYQP